MTRKNSCLDNSRDNEPIFVLCARDPSAPETVRDWAHRAALAGAPPEKTGPAFRVAVEMENWQAENPSLVRVPA